jgi:hypothetical protein
MATDAASLGETPAPNGRTMAQLRAAHHRWTQLGRPVNLKRHTRWMYGREFDVLEDEVGIVEMRRHRDAD